MARPYDVVVFGATGFTGSLVVEYLAQAYAGKPLSWALAGRNKDRLQGVKERVATKTGNNAVKNVDVIVADALDASAIDAMTKKTKVVLSTTGPFWLYGTNLVKSCAENGTSYCDITGESPWVKEMIAKYDQTAKQNKARIVSFCGFDSIPSDVGCYLIARQMRDKHKCSVDRTNGYIISMKGGVSGGTIASMLNLLEQPNFAQLRKEMGSPYELIPKEHRPSFRQPNPNTVSYEEDIGRYSIPFVMASVNSKTVHRTNFLLDHMYGDEFKYCEKATVKGSGWGSFFNSWMSTLGMGAFFTGLAVSPIRSVLKRFLPKPGEGPSEEERMAGKLVFRFIGVGTGPSHPRVSASVVTHKDPGYTETAKMLAEVAVCLAQDGSKLPDRYGLLTPVAAMGDVLVDRLNAAGVECKVEEEASPATPASRL